MRTKKPVRQAGYYSADELAPIVEVLHDFIATFHGPLPAHVVDAMSVIFNLDDGNFYILDNIVLHHAGQRWRTWTP
jgi:hypothetical protein